MALLAQVGLLFQGRPGESLKAMHPVTGTWSRDGGRLSVDKNCGSVGFLRVTPLMGRMWQDGLQSPEVAVVGTGDEVARRGVLD